MIDAVLQDLGNFSDDDDGAVTVDWVVLTAALLSLAAIVSFPAIHRGVDRLGNEISSDIGEAETVFVTLDGGSSIVVTADSN